MPGSGGGGGLDLARIVALLVFIALLGGAAAFVIGAVAPGPNATARPSGTPTPAGPSSSLAPSATGATDPSGAPSGDPGASPAPTDLGGPGTSGGPAASGAPSPGATATPGPPVEVVMPIVPVVRFWSTETAVGEDAVRRALAGEADRYPEVVVPTEDRDAIARAAGLDALGEGVRSGTPDEIRSAVREGALGFLRASDVTTAVRALGIGERELFGTDAVDAIERWPLSITVTEPSDRAWDQTRTWTLAAGGDILFDRGVYLQTRLMRKGPDFPFDGGTVEITGRRCCSPFFNDTYVQTRRTGNAGAMRELLSSADLAIANLENPVDDDFVFHEHGTVFTGDPGLLSGVKNAGIDFVSLANNHIGDAGRDGIKETRAGLDELGIAYAGAGPSLGAAREPAVLEANGTSVAIISCDDIAAYYWAGESSAGSSPCRGAGFVEDIRAAKAEHDVVIVYPHWGIEYTNQPSLRQQKRAHLWLNAGADLIIGSHSHWAGAIEDFKGKMVFYSLGNFVFDQWFTEETSQGIVIELSWHGQRLVQAWVHPIQIIDQSQPNFLDPDGDGRGVIRQVQDGSEGLLPY